MPAVEVDSLVRRFGPVTAVDGATFACEAGAVTCVLGPNGAGKTMTIECLEGLQRPDGGRVRVLGADPWRADAERRTKHVYFCGRLAQYRYFNTDEVIQEALRCFDQIRAERATGGRCASSPTRAA